MIAGDPGFNPPNRVTLALVEPPDSTLCEKDVGERDGTVVGAEGVRIPTKVVHLGPGVLTHPGPHDRRRSLGLDHGQFQTVPKPEPSEEQWAPGHPPSLVSPSSHSPDNPSTSTPRSSPTDHRRGGVRGSPGGCVSCHAYLHTKTCGTGRTRQTYTGAERECPKERRPPTD